MKGVCSIRVISIDTRSGDASYLFEGQKLPLSKFIILHPTKILRILFFIMCENLALRYILTESTLLLYMPYTSRA